MTSSAEIRDLFLKYFESNGHTIVASSPLVPGNDPTLLFTNAGMVQFKDVFLGSDKRSYSTAVTSQRCVRAGGKHNDLENVGYTARHHTFFEMLGNFSFGDYFKKEAINYAWDFLTNTVGLPAEKLWVTVYADDDEAADIWLNDIGIDADRFARIGTSDNFWSMGDTGPCGPCSEIFYDHGPGIEGGPPGTPEQDGDRYIEIWNLVFMQYNRDEQGVMHPLPKPSVDTGMGPERLAAILQQVHNNYDIDLFQCLIQSAPGLTDTDDLNKKSLRVIADHIRSCAFLIVDGVLPSNEGRGYVLRRIIRRAARHGHQLDCKQAFFYQLVSTLDELMGDAYPELRKHKDHVARVLEKEEVRFAETLEQGMRILEDSIAQMQSDTISGETLFKLYDTYGFPVDLTADVARERGLHVDEKGFEAQMKAQKKRARASSQFGVVGNKFDLGSHDPTRFKGYDDSTAETRIVAIIQDEAKIERLDSRRRAIIVLEQTPFYGESGGQVGDIGLLANDSAKFRVEDTQKQDDVYMHIGHLRTGQLAVGDTLIAAIDEEHRRAVILNHSATHLMHAALRQVLGDHVQQKGSLVDAEKLRFDFSHYQPLISDEIEQIEILVNDQVRMNLPTSAELMNMDAAKATGALALFGEKYGETVRVLNIGSDSVELCGGTHVQRTGDIGSFKIVIETGIAAGVRRIEALTGARAIRRFIVTENKLTAAAQALKASREDLVSRVEQLYASNRNKEKERVAYRASVTIRRGGELAAQAVDVKGIKVLAASINGANIKTLRETVDQLKNKLGAAAIVLASSENGKVSIIAGVRKAETGRIRAGDLVNVVAELCGGKGGGRADMAQAGGNLPEKLPEALDAVIPWVKSQL